MELSSIYLPVEKVPSGTISPGYEFPTGINNAIVVNLPDGTKKVVNYVSDIYHLVKNQDVIPPFLQEIQKFWKVETLVRHVGYSQFFVDFILKNDDLKIKILKDDLIFPRIRLGNSYDSKVKYNFAIGFLRQICGNGMTVPYGPEFKIKKLHTPSLSDLTSFEAVMEMTSNFLKTTDTISEVYYELANHKVKSVETRIDDVFDETGFPASLREDVLERAKIEMSQLKLTQANDWLVYNAFNYQLNHSEDVNIKEIKKEQIDLDVLSFLNDY